MDGQQRRRLTEEPVYPYETQSDLVAVLALPRSELEHRSRLMQERHVSYRLFPPIFVSTHTQSKKKSKISVLLDYCALIDASEWGEGGGG